MARSSLIKQGTAAEYNIETSEPNSRGQVCGDTARLLVQRRLSVLRLADSLGSVSAACRLTGMHRSSFYEWKRRFEAKGLAGLEDLPPVPRTHPLKTPPDVIEKVVATSAARPAWGCARIVEHMAAQGITISSPTVQKLLIAHGMGTRSERLRRLEERFVEGSIELSLEQMRLIEKANPCFRARHAESRCAGELLAQDTIDLGTRRGAGRLSLQVVVDTYSAYAFALLHTTSRPDAAVAILSNEVIPFHQGRGLAIGAVLTGNGTVYCGDDTHIYPQWLARHGIEHRRTTTSGTPSKTPGLFCSGYVARFFRDLQDEFLRTAEPEGPPDDLGRLQARLDAWLRYYNYERPYPGYRNMGTPPIGRIVQARQTGQR